MTELTHAEKVQKFRDLSARGQALRDSDPIAALAALREANDLFPGVSGMEQWLKYLEVKVQKMQAAPQPSPAPAPTQSAPATAQTASSPSTQTHTPTQTQPTAAQAAPPAAAQTHTSASPTTTSAQSSIPHTRAETHTPTTASSPVSQTSVAPTSQATVAPSTQTTLAEKATPEADSSNHFSAGQSSFSRPTVQTETTARTGLTSAATITPDTTTPAVTSAAVTPAATAPEYTKPSVQTDAAAVVPAHSTPVATPAAAAPVAETSTVAETSAAPVAQSAAPVAEATTSAPEPSASTQQTAPASGGAIDQEQIKKWVREAEMAAKGGQNDEALRWLDQALGMLRSGEGAGKVHLKLVERRNQIAPDAAHFLEAAKLYLNEGDSTKASQRIEAALRKDAHHIETLELKVRLAKEQNQSHQLLSALMQLSDAYDKHRRFKDFDGLQKEIRSVRESLS